MSHNHNNRVKIAWAMLAAFAVVSVLAGSIIWFSLNSASMVKMHSNQLINKDIPKIEIIDKIDRLLSSESILLYSYYATSLERGDYLHQIETRKQEAHRLIDELKQQENPPTEVEQFLALVDQFWQHSWLFDAEMQGEKDWDELRGILSEARADVDAAHHLLSVWRKAILLDAQKSSQQSLHDVAHMSDLLFLISVVIVSAAAFLLFSFYARLKDRDALFRMAYFDPLTELPNVSKLQKNLEAAIDDGERGYFMLLKLSRTQLLYATYGPELVERARVLVSNWVQGTVGRISPDIQVYQITEEYWGICDPRAQSQVDCLRLIESLLKLQYEPIECGGLKLNLSCHIGATCYPQDGRSFRELYRNAVAAIQRTNESGSDFSLYNIAMRDSYKYWVETEAAIRQALYLDQFELYYQPKINGCSREIESAEALIRWNRDGKWISPGEFIPVAEQSELIIPLGAWVLEAVCKQIQQWKQRGMQLIPIALNISAQQYQDDGFVALVEAKLKQYEIDPALIELEITEEVAATNPEHVIDTMQRLKNIGVRIALDDFGTGYSSLSYLKRFPIDTMKIDRSFVSEMDNSSESVAIVELILSLADELGYRTVAEGVETEAQAQHLTSKGCPLLQGFLFSKPVAPQQFESWLTGENNATKALPEGCGCQNS